MLYRLRALLLILVTILLLPLLSVVCLTILCFNILYVFAGLTRKSIPSEAPPKSGLATIVVLNWNGRDLLAQGLPSILEAVRVDGRPHEVLVVDNGSTDGSREFLKERFPEVRILALKENLGFAQGNNAGVLAAQNDIVVLLNNDMVVDPGFLRPLLRAFGPHTFAVSSQIYLQDSAKKREETGKTTAVFRRGMIDYAHREMDRPPYPRSLYPVFWAGGGSSAFHRGKFLALGGFQDIYSPAYVEDTDLSFQAWRVGWEVLLAPDSVVCHKHRASTTRRFSQSKLQSLITRNQFIFLWKNIHSWKLLLSHGLFLPWNLYRLTRDQGMVAWMSLLKAFRAIPSIAFTRFKLQPRPKRTDSEIFDLFAMPGHFFSRQSAGNAPKVVCGAKPRVLWLTAYLPHTGRHAGAGRMFQLLKRMSSKYQITLITFLETDDERDFLPEVKPFCEKVIAVRRFRPDRWQLFPYEPFDEFRTPEMERAVDRCLEDCDFDLIQLEYTQMAYYATRAEGIPVLLTKHEVDFAACARRARIESNPLVKMRWFYNYLQVLDREVRLTKKVDAVVCMTDPDVRELKKFTPSVPTHTINTGVDLDYFRPSNQPSMAARLIFVGAFQHLPNVEAMMYFCRDVLPAIRTKVPGVELLIVGSNPTPPVLSLAAIPGVKVTGFVPDIRPFMSSSSIYVVPLRLGVGIRGKILEAWGMGMAVVSTSVGCAGLRFENGRNLLVGDTPQQFAAHVISLLNDPVGRSRLGEEGRKTTEQFYSWETSAQQLDMLYQRMIKGTAPNRGNAREHQPQGWEPSQESQGGIR
jgi:GT2 family glycosyltransferase/glycosyltransferase involved in cell wall biosynthesis